MASSDPDTVPFAVFQQSMTTWCPDREEHGYYLAPLFKCSTNPRVSTAHRWSAVDLDATLDAHTGESLDHAFGRHAARRLQNASSTRTANGTTLGSTSRSGSKISARKNGNAFLPRHAPTLLHNHVPPIRWCPSTSHLRGTTSDNATRLSNRALSRPRQTPKLHACCLRHPRLCSLRRRPRWVPPCAPISRPSFSSTRKFVTNTREHIFWYAASGTSRMDSPHWSRTRVRTSLQKLASHSTYTCSHHVVPDLENRLLRRLLEHWWAARITARVPPTPTCLLTPQYLPKHSAHLQEQSALICDAMRWRCTYLQALTSNTLAHLKYMSFTFYIRHSCYSTWIPLCPPSTRPHDRVLHILAAYLYSSILHRCPSDCLYTVH